ncbi:MAG: hypothetical protein E5X48_23685 [Mesorhizobium sp.]|uniref:hypothetical protein n=1 Tax=Mesorhizobium sp. TaxID=1871066 RepID=UPI0012278ECC|nr:hypothetical protein [Mesorhizobium sp.]TIQ33341.1 MAG: hypothetical protein E5X48_23685 [Mesorhizobium sp.]
MDKPQFKSFKSVETREKNVPQRPNRKGRVKSIRATSLLVPVDNQATVRGVLMRPKLGRGLLVNPVMIYIEPNAIYARLAEGKARQVPRARTTNIR